MALNQQGYFSILNNRSALAEVGCRSEGVVRDAGAQENKWFGRCLPISSGPAWDVGAAFVWADVVSACQGQGDEMNTLTSCRQCGRLKTEKTKNQDF